MKKEMVSILLAVTVALAGCGGMDKGMQGTTQSEQSEKQTASSEDALTVAYSDSGFAEAPIKAAADLFAMDTVMTFTVYSDDREKAAKALHAATQDIKRLEAQLSTNRSESEIYHINETGQGKLSESGRTLMTRAIAINKDTGGAFDIAVYPVVKAWGFTTGAFHVPDPKTIDGLLPITKMALVQYDAQNGEVRLTKKGMGIDLGAIAKGYASTRVMRIFTEHGIQSGMVNLGGNVQVLNQKPNGQPFRVGIQNPANPETVFGSVAVNNEAVITSGAYQRFFERDGQKYHHIINPADGYPAHSGLTSVTIVTPDGALADALATSFYIMGRAKAEAYWQAHADRFEMILVDDQQQVFVTEGLADRYKPRELGAPTVMRRSGGQA